MSDHAPRGSSESSGDSVPHAPLGLRIAAQIIATTIFRAFEFLGLALICRFDSYTIEVAAPSGLQRVVAPQSPLQALRPLRELQ